MPRIITIDENRKVCSVKEVGENYKFNNNDYISESGETGQIMQEDGSFINPPLVEVPQVHEPTNAELAQMISDLQADLIIAGVI